MLAGLEDQVDDQAALIDRLARLHMIGPKVGMAGCTGLVDHRIRLHRFADYSVRLNRLVN